MSKALKLNQALVGKTYLTTRGLRIKVVRKRADSDDWVILSLASGGHEIVISGDTDILEDNLDYPEQVVIDSNESETAVARLRRLVSRVLQESGMSMKELSSITPYSVADIEAELTVLIK